MWRMANFRRKRRGFALIFVVLIAVAMIIPVMILASNAVSRRKVVTGEAVSDRSLTVADATVDKILNKINTFPFTFVTPVFAETAEDATNQLIAHYLSEINGGVPTVDASSGAVTNFDAIKNNVSTYLYNLKTQEYYAVWDNTNDKIASVSSIGPDGDVKTGVIKNLNTGELLNGGAPGSLVVKFPNYKTDNLWVEIDANVRYGEDENGNPVPDTWLIRNTAYLLSKPNIKRTIAAKANRGNLTTSSNWYTRETSTEATTVYFSDFSGLYHTKVYFGKYETTTGPIRSDADLYMGGWAQDPVFATGTVYDEACDNGWNHDGRFGPDQNDLNEAKNNGYAFDGYPQATWPNGDAALTGSNPVRVSGDDGLQDKADKDAGYYVDGNATFVFNPDGTVTITPEGEDSYTVPIPANGAMYVTGNATVSGTVKGRCSIGAGQNINIGGNILYNTPPRINRDDLIPSGYTPDALGLIAHDNIYIPISTFNANNHLEVDAALLSVHGSFGIGDSDGGIGNGYNWRSVDPSGTYQAWWNGCQAEWTTDNAPAWSSGSSVEGYEIQHTNYDWNLYDFGPPPFYPPTNSHDTEHTTARYVIVTNAGILKVLRGDPDDPADYPGLKKSDLTPIDPSAADYNDSYPYKYFYNDNSTWYYCGTHLYTATIKNSHLYRISWKEQIAKPVKP